MDSVNFLSYIIWDVNPDMFVIPYIDHPVRWYGVSWALGFILSNQIMNFVYKKEGRTIAEIDSLTMYMVISTIIGARLGHCLFYDPIYYLHNPLRILAVWEGGLASHGGAIGIFIATYLFARKTNVAYLWILDRLAIVGALTGCCIRMGNLMNSEMIGLPTDLPWAFVFTSVDDLPRHPAQLYEAIYCLILFVGLFWVWYKFRERLKNGFIISWFLIILFTLRFIDEFFKVSQEAFEDDMILNMGQILSIPLVLAGIIILITNGRKSNPTSSPTQTK
jgi:phosphatidylglycerol:prolipoprotein diacylglycerol transferase